MNIPQPPTITEEEFQKCLTNKDFRLILFEWYKYTGAICNFYASFAPESEIFRKVDKIQHAVLIGLLNRCSRLMLSNIALSQNNLFAETTALIDRCIFESAIKVIWLCQKKDNNSFERYLADGLKTELELKNKINENITSRNGKIQFIENRMLKSIDNYILKSGLNEKQINETKKLPNLASMIDHIYENRLLYITGQKIGSHHIHGTWPNLLSYFLNYEDDKFFLRDHDCTTKTDQYIFIPIFVIDAIKSYLHFICNNDDEADKLCILPNGIIEEIDKIFSIVVENDFEFEL